MTTNEHTDISRLDTSDWMGFMVNKPTPLTFGELFAGVGGFGMGMEQAGYEPVFQVEWDKNCLKVLHHHWPTVPKWHDVCDVNGADLPPCDVLIFGSPCQDLSVAGKRAGLQDGEKSSMFFEAVRIIKEMRDATNNVYPRATIWENVPGALSSNRGADFGIVLESLADIGANLQEYAVLDAQYFRSTPQRRRRIFLISIFDLAASERCPDPLLPVIQGSRGDFAKGRKARKDFARNVEASLDTGGRWWNGGDLADCLTATSNEQRAPDKARLQAVIEGDVYGQGSFGQFVEGQISTIRQAGGDLGGGSENLVVQEAFVKSRQAQSNTDDETWIEGEVTPTLNAFDNGGESRATVLMPFVFDGTRHDDFRMDSETVPTLKQRMGTGGGQVPMVAEPVAYDEYNDSINEIHHAIRAGTKQSTGVIQPIYSFDTGFGSNAAIFEDQSPTLKASQQSPSITMPGLSLRRLTPLECERLMGWPDDHTRWTADGKEQADTNRYRQCGNGVATPVAAWVGEQLRQIL
tara:strand:- start:2303 stop:3862 length:1560 start_codon:yes stop_codon:yes gene_type:complete